MARFSGHFHRDFHRVFPGVFPGFFSGFFNVYCFGFFLTETLCLKRQQGNLKRLFVSEKLPLVTNCSSAKMISQTDEIKALMTIGLMVRTSLVKSSLLNLESLVYLKSPYLKHLRDYSDANRALISSG